MSCQGCVDHVQKALSNINDVTSVSIDLADQSATIEMENHVPLEDLQKSLEGSNYSIETYKKTEATPLPKIKPVHKAGTKYYCPMKCEGDKVYDKPGDCPKCGMDLIPEVTQDTHYTCPMHPEIDSTEPGSCPKCGMDLVPKEPVEDNTELKNYYDLKKKFWVATAFTVPIFTVAMGDMLPDAPFSKIMPAHYWNWIQLIFSIPVVF